MESNKHSEPHNNKTNNNNNLTLGTPANPIQLSSRTVPTASPKLETTFYKIK